MATPVAHAPDDIDFASVQLAEGPAKLVTNQVAVRAPMAADDEWVAIGFHAAQEVSAVLVDLPEEHGVVVTEGEEEQAPLHPSASLERVDIVTG